MNKTNEKIFGNNIDYASDNLAEILLGRDSIVSDNNSINDYISGKTVLVTGGGGSVGSELCRRIMTHSPSKLIILDIYENNAYELLAELKHSYPDNIPEVIIASVRDMDRLENVFAKYIPNIVFHAAAHKHVPLMENNPGEAVKNNVFGALNTALCADKYNTEKFVMIFTDKAVRPSNIMGATKKICEMLIQYMKQISRTGFIAVRFGNVLGSNGSVLPLFEQQIKAGGPVTVTDKRVTRFFMTIPEAAQLVLYAASCGESGNIFTLDMGNPVKIYDMAVNLIRLFGYVPHKDIKIELCGLRSGEKLYEENLMDEKGLQKTGHSKIFITNTVTVDKKVFESTLESLRAAVDTGDDNIIRAAVSKAVSN